MTASLPYFRFHPNPLQTGAIIKSNEICDCCGEVRGYIYAKNFYSKNHLNGHVCPWCIANGSAASNLGATFSFSIDLSNAGISNEAIEELELRTPGYESWQGESWLHHCNDICEFHGDASIDDVKNASDETKKYWLLEYKQDEKTWLSVSDGYTPKGNSSLYKFKCRHCNIILFGWDLC